MAKDQQTCMTVLVKVSENSEMNFKEHSILMELRQFPYFPILYGGGNFDVQGKPKQSFIVMEKLGKNLDEILGERQTCFSLQTICQLGIYLIAGLKSLHEIGCLHNDIKPENIVTSTERTHPFQSNS